MLKMFQSSGQGSRDALDRDRHLIEVTYLIATALVRAFAEMAKFPVDRAHGVWAGDGRDVAGRGGDVLYQGMLITS